MKVKVDGEDLSLEDGAILEDALDRRGRVNRPGTVVGIIKGRSQMARETDSYWIVTNKGKVRIRIEDGTLSQVWHQCLTMHLGLECNGLWSNASAAAFGPFPSSMSPTREAHEYNRWEVVLGAAGFQAQRTQVIFVKRRHSAAYGSPMENRGVFARVVGGKGTLENLEAGDQILSVEPIVEWEKLTDKIATEDLTTPLEEGMEIYTRFDVQLLQDAPQGAEFFLAATRGDTFTIDGESSSYLKTKAMQGEPIKFEHREPRLEGAITIRTRGRGSGNIFIYKADRTSSPGHSVIARVTSGMDLLKLASAGQSLTVAVNPERFMLTGKPLQEAQQIAKVRGVAVKVEGYSGEDAVVVDQKPNTTMEVLKEGNVRFKTISARRLVAIKLFDEAAPKSIDYFRHVVGLKERNVGPLPVFFVYENTVLFKPVVDAVSYKELLPENKPEGPVPAGYIAVTNQVAKKIGLVGVKFVEDKRYGPSGEKFEGTNLIGQVLDLEKLRDVEEGDMVYVLEVER